MTGNSSNNRFSTHPSNYTCLTLFQRPLIGSFERPLAKPKTSAANGKHGYDEAFLLPSKKPLNTNIPKSSYQ